MISGFKLWTTDAEILTVEDLLEAKAKDEFPLGTIKQYGEKHLYVKVGGKKPWVYYATLGTEKANAAIAAGGVVVVDGKGVGPATPEMLQKHGFEHPSVGGAPAWSPVDAVKAPEPPKPEPIKEKPPYVPTTAQLTYAVGEYANGDGPFPAEIWDFFGKFADKYGHGNKPELIASVALRIGMGDDDEELAGYHVSDELIAELRSLMGEPAKPYVLTKDKLYGALASLPEYPVFDDIEALQKWHPKVAKALIALTDKHYPNDVGTDIQLTRAVGAALRIKKYGGPFAVQLAHEGLTGAAAGALAWDISGIMGNPPPPALIKPPAKLLANALNGLSGGALGAADLDHQFPTLVPHLATLALQAGKGTGTMFDAAYATVHEMKSILHFGTKKKLAIVAGNEEQTQYISALADLLDNPEPPKTDEDIGWEQFPDPELAKKHFPDFVKELDAVGGNTEAMSKTAQSGYANIFGPDWKKVYKMVGNIRGFAVGGASGLPAGNISNIVDVADQLPALAKTFQTMIGPKWKEMVKAMGQALKDADMLHHVGTPATAANIISHDEMPEVPPNFYADIAALEDDDDLDGYPATAAYVNALAKKHAKSVSAVIAVVDHLSTNSVDAAKDNWGQPFHGLIDDLAATFGSPKIDLEKFGKDVLTANNMKEIEALNPVAAAYLKKVAVNHGISPVTALAMADGLLTWPVGEIKKQWPGWANQNAVDELAAFLGKKVPTEAVPVVKASDLAAAFSKWGDDHWSSVKYDLPQDVRVYIEDLATAHKTVPSSVWNIATYVATKGKWAGVAKFVAHPEAAQIADKVGSMVQPDEEDPTPQEISALLGAEDGITNWGDAVWSHGKAAGAIAQVVMAVDGGGVSSEARAFDALLIAVDLMNRPLSDVLASNSYDQDLVNALYNSPVLSLASMQAPPKKKKVMYLGAEVAAAITSAFLAYEASGESFDADAFASANPEMAASIVSTLKVNYPAFASEFSQEDTLAGRSIQIMADLLKHGTEAVTDPANGVVDASEKEVAMFLAGYLGIPPTTPAPSAKAMKLIIGDPWSHTGASNIYNAYNKLPLGTKNQVKKFIANVHSEAEKAYGGKFAHWDNSDIWAMMVDVLKHGATQVKSEYSGTEALMLINAIDKLLSTEEVPEPAPAPVAAPVSAPAPVPLAAEPLPPMPYYLKHQKTPKKGPIFQAIKNLGLNPDTDVEAKILAMTKSYNLKSLHSHLHKIWGLSEPQATAVISKIVNGVVKLGASVSAAGYIDYPDGFGKKKKIPWGTDAFLPTLPTGSSVTAAPSASPAPSAAFSAPSAVPLNIPATPSAPSASKIPAGIPPVSSLTLKGSADHMGGAGKKRFYTDAQGKQYIFKVAASKSGGSKPEPLRAEVQAAFSAIARKVKAEHPPIGAVTIGGTVGAIYPFIDADGNLAGTSPADLSPSEKVDVATEHMLDWLGSQHDSHPANLLRSNGRIIGVDKEQGFKYFGSDKLSVDYHPNSQYGENEPYYNTFWRDWSNGKFDFDPKHLDESLAKIEAVSGDEYIQTLRPYAETRFPGDPYEQERFLRKALSRKLTLRRDFEKFVTDLYRKKTGVKDGKFTFAAGWKVKGEAEKPTILKKTFTAKEYADKQGVNIRPYKSNSGGEDPTKLTLKVSKGSIEDLETFLKEMNITPLGPVKQGSNYSMVFVNKADFDNATLTKEEVIQPKSADDLAPHPGKPSYMPVVEYLEPADPNSSLLTSVDGMKDLGEGGKRFTVDGPAVEGQVMKVKRRKDSEGVFYDVHFKLRESYAQEITGGTSDKYSFHTGTYNADSDTLSQGSMTSLSCAATRWEDGNSKIFLARKHSSASYYEEEAPWALKNSVYARVRPKAGETVDEALARVLDKMKPGMSKEIIRDPSAAERQAVVLSRLLSARAPQKHDAMAEKARTPEAVKQALKGVISNEQIAAVREVETIPGHATHVLPGQWREAKTSSGEAALRFLYFGASTPSRIANMVKNGGLFGIHERIMAGKDDFGESVGEDLKTGGADNVTLRMAVAGADHKSMGDNMNVQGTYNIIIAPDECDRLDPYLAMGDAFGATNPSSSQGSHWTKRKSLPAAISAYNSSPSTSNVELVVRRGVSSKKFLRITCSGEHTRETLVNEFKSKGIEEINGVPIEDFVVVESNIGQTFQKYVKPAGF